MVEINGNPVTIQQTTRYPWDGIVGLKLSLNEPSTFSLHLRVPGWCKQYRLQVNGAALELSADSTGYLAIEREWRSGDQVTFEMEMPVEAVWANPQVRQLEGRVAIQRGPLIYCLEGADHGGIILDRISVDPRAITSQFQVEYKPDLLGGVAVITGKGNAITETGWGEALYQGQAPAQQEIALTAVPYCVWDNRDPGEMRVWLRAQ
jgi:hypothetical protein